MQAALLAIGLVALLWLFNRNQGGPTAPATGSTAPGTNSDAWDNIEQGIANAENVNPAHNNPGAIMSGGSLANFADVGDGWDRFDGLLKSKIAANPGWDFYDLAGNWVNGDTTSTAQNANNWAESVAKYLGVEPTSPVSLALGDGA